VFPEPIHIHHALLVLWEAEARGPGQDKTGRGGQGTTKQGRAESTMQQQDRAWQVEARAKARQGQGRYEQDNRGQGRAEQS